MKRIAFCVAAAAALAAPAAASEPRALSWAIPFVPTQITIRHSDLNLRSAAGAAVLLQRIERASRRACDSTPSDVRRIDHRRLLQYCVRLNVAAAVEAADEPMVTSLHRGRQPGVLLAWH